jgi:SAM-dependent methyltransferase
VSNQALSTDSAAVFTSTVERGAIRYEAVEIRPVATELLISQSDLQRFDRPAADAAFPLEYAFHLLGDFRGKTVVDLGCGDGANVTILASLGARVIAVDPSYEELKQAAERLRANRVRDKATLIHSEGGRIPVADASVDRILCVAQLHNADCVGLARQIRRILKPGGISVFVAPLVGLRWLKGLKNHLRALDCGIDLQSSLTLEQAQSVSRAVGREGRRREFKLTSRVLECIGAQSLRTMRKSHELDAWILRRFAFARALASSLVWEARKES